jgi:hypothetical protein
VFDALTKGGQPKNELAPVLAQTASRDGAV